MTRLFENRSSIVFVVIVSLAFAVSAWALSKFMDRAYLAETSLLIAKEDGSNSLSQVAGQFGGVAALLGAGAAGNTDINEALAILKSRLLVTAFLTQEQRLSKIRSIMKDASTSRSDSLDQTNLAADYFLGRILSVTYDVRTGIITLSITWRDRQEAADWANSYVALANEIMRKRQIDEAKSRLTFLRAAVERAQTVDLQQAIYKLIESQVRTEMLAVTRPEFAFRVVDQAVPAQPNRVVRPKSALMGLVAGLLGAMLAVALVALRGKRSSHSVRV